MRLLPRRPALVLLLLIGALARPGAGADPPEYEKFFGEYVGQAAAAGTGKVETRDIRATIGPLNQGFTVAWVMNIHRVSGKEKHVEYKMTFLPTDRKSLYSAAMRMDAFGNAVPLNPIKGDPYVWARIDGQILSIYAMTITETGGYDMQVYDRKLVPGGMDLKYSRVLDGEVLKTITGKLKKIR